MDARSVIGIMVATALLCLSVAALSLVLRPKTPTIPAHIVDALTPRHLQFDELGNIVCR